MFGGRRRETEQLIVRMERQLDLVHTALVVRDPGTSVSADAYEGLRKQVVASATARQAHVAQLAEFDVALARGASAEDLRAMVTQWLEQAGVARVEDPGRREAFDSSLPPGVDADVETPAYINTATGQLVRQGRLRTRTTSRHVPETDEMTTNSAQATQSQTQTEPGEQMGIQPSQEDMEAN